jgi:hypothetical protein
MKFSFVGLLLLSLAAISAADPAPINRSEAGTYAGFVLVTKTSGTDRLTISARYAVAVRILPDGSTTILSSQPAIPPPDASLDSSITRLALDQNGFFRTDKGIYADVRLVGRNGLRIRYQDPPLEIQSTGTAAVTITAPDRYTTFEYFLTRK